MKLAAIYNTFDGEELLEGSIATVADHVDEIIIVYQTVSNTGENYPEILTTLSAIKEQRPTVRLIKHEPVLALGAQANEIEKRNKGKLYAQQLGCTHYVLLDNDEYYPDFAKGKQYFIDNNLDTSYCKIITYWKDFEHVLQPLERYYVPFICNIETEIAMGFPVLVDPTRGAQPWGRIGQVPIYMHHYSYVRKDMGRKLRNSTANVNWDWRQRLEQFEGWKEGDPHPFMPNHKIIRK